MTYKVPVKNLGIIFTHANDSLWIDKFGTVEHKMTVQEQIDGWREKFHATIYGGHFDYVNDKHGEHEWNTHDAILEFDSEDDYMLFMLEWS